MKLYLSDIDGTLIDSGGAGTRALNKAFERRFRLQWALRGISMAGKTDTQIICEALGGHNLPADDGYVPELLSLYVEYLEMEMENDRKHIKPGVIDILDRLSGREDCATGLLTGNIKDGARIKLNSFNLSKYFVYKGIEGFSANAASDLLGAFGSDNADRSKLLPYAVKRYREAYGADVGYADCVVIGDTPLDVMCAKTYGAISVAVATGPYSMDLLRETSPDMVLPDLTGYEPLLSFLG